VVPRLAAKRLALADADASAPVDAKALARTFKGAKAPTVAEVLEALATLGQAHRLPDGKFAAVRAA
jgi:hypothetical protein